MALLAVGPVRAQTATYDVVALGSPALAISPVRMNDSNVVLGWSLSNLWVVMDPAGGEVLLTPSISAWPGDINAQGNAVINVINGSSDGMRFCDASAQTVSPVSVPVALSPRAVALDQREQIYGYAADAL